MRRLGLIGLALGLAGVYIGCTQKEGEQPQPPSPTATPAAQTTPQPPPKGVQQMASVEEGKPAPSFSLPASNGKTVSLADFRGTKQVVLYFYPKDDTPGCTREACSFRDNIAQIEGKDAVILGVSRDGLASHEKFIGKYSLPFILLSDKDGAVCRAYGALVEVDGKPKFVRSTFVIDKDGKIKKTFPKVKVDGHTEQVLAALD